MSTAKRQPHDLTTGRFKRCRRALTTEQVAILAYRWNAGDDQGELAKEYNLSRTTARRLVKDFLRARKPDQAIRSLPTIQRDLPFVATYSASSEPRCCLCGGVAAENLGTARFVEVDAELRPICSDCRGDTPTVGFHARYRQPVDQHFHM